MASRRAALLVAILWILGWNLPARADLIAFFGGERAGTSGGQFLRVPAGARALAMGGGMSATAEDAGSVFWNPAGMSQVKEYHNFFVSHLNHVADIDIDHVAYVYRGGSWQWGLSAGVLRSGDILRTTELHPTGTDYYFQANQFFGGFSLGRRLTDRFAFASTLKFLQENLDDYETRGFFLDLGALYYLGYKQARIGFTVRNFGNDLKLNGTPPDEANLSGGWQSFPAPTVAVFGFAYDFGSPAERHWTMSLDFNHPSDEVESVIWGNEIHVGRGLFLRGAYRNKVEDGGFSAGFGLNFRQKNTPFRFSYGFDDHGTFGGLHMFSLEVGR